MDYEPLDFEREDPILRPTPVATKKRKRIIGLDDLLADHYEETKRKEKEAKARTKGKKKYDSDEDENGREALLSKLLNKCQNQMNEIKTDEEAPEWGLQAFTDQKPMPSIVPPELVNSSLLQPFMSNQLNSLVGLAPETGFSFLEGLLLNGWLSRLVCRCGLVDKEIGSLTFNLMLYSSNEELASSACEFWCALLSAGNKIGSPPKMGWVPNCSELRKALQIYGFRFAFSLSAVAEDTGSIAVRPPQNIRFWLKVIASCCHMRERNSIFSTSEAEELLEVVILLSLDRQLQGLSPLVYNCMQSLISYFVDKEWSTSCTRVSRSIACRIPKDSNCLQTLKLISGLDSRSKNLLSSVAFHILANCLDNKDGDDSGILNQLLSIDLKGKTINFFKIYMYLVLAQNWLLNSTLLEDKPALREMWVLYLRRCSCQISSTNLRSYASKVRNKASFLLQDTGNKRYVAWELSPEKPRWPA